MRTRRRYSIIIEDESRLENVVRLTMSPAKLCLMIAGIVVFLMIAGTLTVAFTPARALLPGYLKDSERAATEEQHLRLDSLLEVYDNNQAYIANFMEVINTDRDVDRRQVEENDSVSGNTTIFSADSLLPTSLVERKFLSVMMEREKYNISVIAPLAAESMMFTPVNESSVVTQASQESTKADVILAKGSTVAAIADGKVIAVSQSVREGGGSAVIIQHPKGFLSRLSRLGNVLIEPGDNVTGGQVIALTSRGNSRMNEHITIEIWHNGTPLIPYDYLGDKDTETPRYPILDQDVGRGRL